MSSVANNGISHLRSSAPSKKSVWFLKLVCRQLHKIYPTGTREGESCPLHARQGDSPSPVVTDGVSDAVTDLHPHPLPFLLGSLGWGLQTPLPRPPYGWGGETLKTSHSDSVPGTSPILDLPLCPSPPTPRVHKTAGAFCSGIPKQW